MTRLNFINASLFKNARWKKKEKWRIFMGNTHFPQKHPHTHKFCTAKTRILEAEKVLKYG